jgi:hypothetical protein
MNKLERIFVPKKIPKPMTISNDNFFQLFLKSVKYFKRYFFDKRTKPIVREV